MGSLEEKALEDALKLDCDEVAGADAPGALKATGLKLG